MTPRLPMVLLCGAALLLPVPGFAQGTDPRLENAWRLAFEADRARQAGDLVASERAIREALGICQSLGQLAPYCLVPARQRAGWLLAARGENGMAERVFRDLVRMADAIYRPPSPWHAQLRLNLAVTIADQRRYREAEPLLREALPLAEAVVATQPQLRIDILSHLGVALFHQGRVADAVPLLRASLDAEAAAGRTLQPGNTTRLNLAEALRQIGEFAESEAMLRQAIAEGEARLGADDPALAGALRSLALTLAEQGQGAAALALQQRALDLRQRAFVAPHREIAIDLMHLGNIIEKNGRTEDAGAALAASLAMFESLGPAALPDVANLSVSLAQLRHRQSRLAEAEALLLRALAIRTAQPQPDGRDVATVLITLGFVLRDAERLPEARDAARRAQDAVAAAGADDAVQGRLLVLRSDLARLDQQPDQAVAMLDRAQAIFAARQTPPDAWTAQVLLSQGLILLERGDPAAAEPLLATAMRITPRTGTLFAHAQSLLRLGRLAEATAELRQAEERYAAEGSYPLAPALVALQFAIMADRQGQRPEADAHLAQALLALQRHAAAGTRAQLSGLLSAMASHAIGTNRVAWAQDLAARAVDAAAGAPSQSLLEAWRHRGRAAMAARDMPAAREAYRTALALARDLHGPDHVQLAWVLSSLAVVERIEGQGTAAAAYAEAALAGFERNGIAAGQAEARNTLGLVAMARGDYREAEALLRRAEAETPGTAFATRSSILGSLSAVLRRLGKIEASIHAAERSVQAEEAAEALGGSADRAGALNLLALAHAASTTPWVAEPIFREVLAMRERDLPPLHPDLARSLMNLGDTLAAAGRGAEAEPLLLRALKINEAALPPLHPELAEVLMAMVDFRTAQGRYAEAEALQRQALAIRAAIQGGDQLPAALARAGLARILFLRGQVDEARTLYRDALAGLQTMLASGTPALEQVKLELGRLELWSGRTQHAEPLLRGAQAALQTIFGPAHPRLVGSLLALSELATALGEAPEALLLAERALAIGDARGVRASVPDMLRILRAVAWARMETGHGDQAVAALERAAALLASTGAGSPVLEADLLLARAAAAMQQGRYAEAELGFQRHLALLGTDWYGRIPGLNALALLRMAQGDGAAAASLLEEALRLLGDHSGSLLPTTGRLLVNLAAAYDLGGRPAEAALARDRGVEMLIRAGWAVRPSPWL